MPQGPPRQPTGRGSTRPGAKRETRPASPPPSAPVSTDRSAVAAPVTEEAPRSQTVSNLALSLTNRVIALVVTIAVLAISFVSGFSVYLGQKKDIAAAQAEIAAHLDEIGRLQDQLNRWDDPAYVRAQARDRLGWVLPGEVGYRVVDADGQLIGGTVGSLDADLDTSTMAWYDILTLSLQGADQPVPQ